MGLPQSILQRGSRASQPAASAVAEGTLYCVTDENYILEQSVASAWVDYSPTGGSGTVTNTGTLTANALILGNGGVDVTPMASLGTTTTVLHGNAAGAPTFGAVSLTADVSGDLPFANLAQIAGLSVLGVTGSSTADVAAITAGADGDVLRRASSSSLVFSQIGVPRYVVAASDDSDSDNTLHNDPELVFAVEANATYVIEAWLQFTSGASSTPDVRVGWTMPASATVQQSVFGVQTGATSSTSVVFGSTGQETTPTTTFSRGVIASTSTGVWIRGTLITAGTSGNLQLQFAQDVTTGGTPTVRKAGSFIGLTRVS